MTDIYIGVDEVGRGALSCQVLAAAVYLPPDHGIVGINDSKKLSAKKRERLYDEIMNRGKAKWAAVDNKVIDKINILQATLLAMKTAVFDLVSSFSLVPSYVVVDGTHKIPDLSYNQIVAPRADSTYECVAAASIIAKVTRDRIMAEYSKDPKYAKYKWDINKGYGTKEHMYLIALHGPSDLHRMTFGGVK